ncbi:MAG TPA: HAD-IA family hydrolase [Bryobacteraceae bacterium]|nr:HAD-IA family hydrolase [Bryobacteraceae bacterium]
MLPQFPVYLFDVDGTLLDSVQDICAAIQGSLCNTAHKDVSHAFLRRYIGRHLIDLYQDLLPDYSREQMDALVVEYRRIYHERNHGLTQAYPGIAEALAALPGRKSTATTKGTPTTRLVLERFSLLPYFDHVQGTDGFPAKPEPDVILASLQIFGARPDDCLLVGDSAADMEAGKRAGVKTCAVLWGYGEREELARWSPDYWVSSPSDLANTG